MALQISLSVGDYDRTRAIHDGRVRIEGCDTSVVMMAPEEAFHRAFKYQEFDVTEISMSSHMLSLARGDNQYVAVPAFVSRLFRHSGIYIRTDRGINRLEDLKGKTVGVPEYQMTANLWIRGMLQDLHGVKPSDIVWRGGGLEDAGREERTRITLPKDVDYKRVPDDRTLSDMFAKGEIDAIFAARAPSCVLRGEPNVRRMFPDYPKVEEEYFQKTKIFPIMHGIGIRKSLAEKHPWLAVSVYKAFLAAKAICMEELGQIGHLAVSQPWSVYEHERLQNVMGKDYWSYGAHENKHVLEAMARYSFEQGLSVRPLKFEEIFAPSIYELSKI
jgi:4,5-dihydroxyphthalate decarboxylase